MNASEAIGYLTAVMHAEPTWKEGLWAVADLIEHLARKADELDALRKANLVPLPPPPCRIGVYTDQAAGVAFSCELRDELDKWTSIVNTFAPPVPPKPEAPAE